MLQRAYDSCLEGTNKRKRGLVMSAEMESCFRGGARFYEELQISFMKTKLLLQNNVHPESKNTYWFQIGVNII